MGPCRGQARDGLERLTAAAEFRSNWPLVLASFVGLTASAGAIPVQALGTLSTPMQAELGASPASIGTSLALIAGGVTVATPLWGRLVDRIGPRPVAMVSLAAYALLFGLVPWLIHAHWQFNLLYLAIGLVGAGSGAITYTRAIGSRFFKARGTALGIALSGLGAATFATPLVVYQVAYSFGWRAACLVLAGFALFVAMPLVYFFLGSDKPAQAAAARADQGEGGELRAALRDPRFLFLMTTIILFGIFIASLIIFLVPMLIERGMPPGRAALLASVLGASALIGRILIGTLLDRWNSLHVAAAVFVLGALGTLAMTLDGTQQAVVTVILIGLINGAELDLIAFMTLQWFGVAAYGRLYGVLFSTYTGANAIGPLICGLLIGATGYTMLYTVAGSIYLLIGFAFIAAAGIFRGRATAQDSQSSEAAAPGPLNG